MTDFAHTTAAEQARMEKAKTLARWCYTRGIRGHLLEVDPAVLRSLARQAGVNPPHQVGAVSPTWQLVDELLVARAQWDRDHSCPPPPAAAVCVACVVRGSLSCGHPVPWRTAASVR